MPTDPSIILGAKPIDMPNPLDSAVKALTMSNLMQEHQGNAMKLNQEQRAMSDTQSLRDAFKNNTQAAPDGSPIVDRQGVMSDLMKANPILAQKQAMDFKQMDLDKMIQQHAVEKQAAFSVPTEPDVPIEQKQAAYTAARNKLIQSGSPGVENSPEQYPGDSWMRQFQVHTLTAEEQLAQRSKQVDQAQKGQEINLKNKELQVQLGGKVDAASQALSNDLDPDKNRAGNFGVISSKVQAADRLKTLIGSFKDGNLPAAQTEELALGLSNMIAPGNGGSREQVKALVPASALGDATKTASWLANQPLGANQQAFVKQMEHTVDREKGVAMDQLNQIRAGRLAAHSWLQQVAPDKFNAILQNKGMDPSKVIAGQYLSGIGTHPQDAAAVTKANSILANKNSSAEDRALAQRVLDANKGKQMSEK
jgi:hypothetical protein